MKVAYLGLGSNIGDREDHLQQALDRINSAAVRVRRVSSVYETAPRDVPNQPAFLNLVAEVESDLLPMSLLRRANAIERELGRQRVVVKGPRTVDIDILLYGTAIVRTPQLTIPHERMHERRFVLEPLAELAPDLRHPALRKTIRELLPHTAGQAVRRIEWKPSISP